MDIPQTVRAKLENDSAVAMFRNAAADDVITMLFSMPKLSEIRIKHQDNREEGKKQTQEHIDAVEAEINSVEGVTQTIPNDMMFGVKGTASALLQICEKDFVGKVMSNEPVISAPRGAARA